MLSFSPENLLQNSVDESWTDTNLNRVSVIQFLDEPKADDEEESGAERRVRRRVSGGLLAPNGNRHNLNFFSKMGSHYGVHVSPCNIAADTYYIFAVQRAFGVLRRQAGIEEFPESLCAGLQCDGCPTGAEL